VPPVAWPTSHSRPTTKAVVMEGTSRRFIGASGTVRIEAPFPLSEVREEP
jgi:hypothetical protein